jgi:hypothetical protein
MLDLSYFQNQNSNVQGFFNAGTWQTWIKPRGAKMVNIICQGAGAGGGGGFQSASTPRGGGGGGGSGATARLVINANLLPDILYILPGIGGAGGLGGTTATAGSPGQNSFVTLIPSTGSVSNVVLRSGTTPATAGGAGTTAAGGTGAAETISAIANNIFANLGIFTFQAGVNANSAGTAQGAIGSPINYLVSAGGGGGTGAGGAGTGTTTFGVFPGIPTTPVNTNGFNGITLYKPILMLYGGGGGGGSSAAGTNGGNGGNGAPGAGGGGGGASTNTGVNAGNGGKGGDGFIIITTSL